MPFVYFGKRGAIRFYFGTSDGGGGYYYMEVAYEGMDMQTSLGRPRPDELPVLDRGNLNSSAHHIQGPDTPIIQPVPITWSCFIDNTWNKDLLLTAMGNVQRISPWQIAGVTLTNTNGTTMVLNGNGSYVSTPLPYDSQHDRINVEFLFRGDPRAAAGTQDYGNHLGEVWFNPGACRIVEASDSLKMNITGGIYGPISQISAFGPGTALTSYTGV
jgi:hypothetical protein